MLGVESYAIIGLFGTIQAALSLCDFGFRASFAREIARYKGGALTKKDILEHLKSIEIILIIVSAFVILTTFITSDWLSSQWFKDAKISHENIAFGVVSMAIMAAARFVEAIYSSGIEGLQKQVYLSLMQAILVTIQNFGALGILFFYSAELNLFFKWQIFFSILSLTIFKCSLHFFIPSENIRVSFSISPLVRTWKFSSGVFAISLLAFFLTQIDRIILSGILSLSELGSYLICVTISSLLYMVANPISQAFYPKFVELMASKSSTSLKEEFRFGSQLMVVMVGAVGMLIIFFGKEIVKMWTNSIEQSNNMHILLSLVALGTLLNVLIWIPSKLQLAQGWTRLGIYENLLGIALLTPGILFFTPKYGPLSAAIMWVVLNIFYLIFGVNMMFSKIMGGERFNWFFWDTSLPLILTAAAAYLCRIIVPRDLDIIQTLLILFLVFIVLLSVGIASSPIRYRILSYRRG